jgi:hypothetical protein
VLALFGRIPTVYATDLTQSQDYHVFFLTWRMLEAALDPRRTTTRTPR